VIFRDLSALKVIGFRDESARGNGGCGWRSGGSKGLAVPVYCLLQGFTIISSNSRTVRIEKAEILVDKTSGVNIFNSCGAITKIMRKATKDTFYLRM
jgi:hypothetical protein